LASAATPAVTEPAWLTDLRERGRKRADELPVPVIKDKGWEFTDLSDFDAGSYAAADFQFEIAGLDDLPDGVIVAPLSEAAAEHPGVVEQHLGSLVLDRDRFAARNTAEWAGGVFVYVPSGVRVERPIEITVTQSEPGSALSWRSLIVVEPTAQATVTERYLSSDERLDAYFNPVTELIVGEQAKLEYLCEQNLSANSWILGSQRAQVGTDAFLHWIGLGFGSGRGKLRMETDLRGRGSTGRVTGAYAASDRQRLDYETTQEHFAPDTISDLAFRGILRDRAKAVWSGMIKVDPGAQKTDAFQESRNLLLGDGAHADAIPGLEIEANDVRCTHAATISKIDEGQIFYLQTRGIERADAERLLVSGFMEVVAGRLEHSDLLQTIVSEALERELERVLA
jgi:Fe-S cluster assembly protein SufD